MTTDETRDRSGNTPTDEMIEAGARALFEESQELDQDNDWDDELPDDWRQAWKDAARECITAALAAAGVALPKSRKPKRLLNQLNRIAGALEDYEFEGVAVDAPAWMRKAAEYIETERQWRGAGVAPPAPSEDREKLIAEAEVLLAGLSVTSTGDRFRNHRMFEIDGPPVMRRLIVALAAPAPVDEAKLAEALEHVEGTHQIHSVTCVCGFQSHRARTRTEHITGAVRERLDSLRGEGR